MTEAAYGEDAVAAVRHGRPLGYCRDARQACGSLSHSTRCPAVEYNPFPDMDGCAKLPWVRRGLRFTVSLRTGVIFLATKDWSSQRLAASWPECSGAALRRKKFFHR
jgi:hypothetical protein